MVSLLIRNVDPALHATLKARAAEHGHSMEVEARELIRSALVTGIRKPLNIAELARSLFEPLGGLELPDNLRETLREPPDFAGPGYDPPEP